MKLKAVCEATGLSRKTIRLYEEKGLLVPQMERRNGRDYREYTQADVDALREIATLRRAWFTMDEIARMQQNPETIGEIFPQYLQWLENQKETLERLLTAARAIEPGTVQNIEELSRRMQAADRMPLPAMDIQPHFRYLDAQEQRPPKVSLQDAMLLVFKTRSQAMLDETRKLATETQPVKDRAPQREPLWLKVVQIPITAVTFCSFGVACLYAMGMRFFWQAWLVFSVSGGLWAGIARWRYRREQAAWVQRMGWDRETR